MSRFPLIRRELRLLLGHGARRAGAAIRRPRPGVWLSVLIPLVLVIGALWAAGAAALPDVSDVGGAVGVGFLVSAPLAFLAYGVLFRPSDDPFLRRLGFSAHSLYLVRALRMLGLALGTAAVILVPFLAAGAPLAPPVVLVLAGALVAWGAALAAFSHAADLASAPGRRPGAFSRMLAMDRELAAVGPLVYAPLAPLFGALFAAGWVGASATVGWGRVGIAALAGFTLAAAGVRPFGRALPRFAPRALEMTFSPPPAAGEAGLVIDGGLSRLLPRRLRAVRARDAAIAGRRFRWTTGLIWPVVIVSAVALARWSEVPAVRMWVVAAGALTLAAHGAATVGLGRIERSGPRWVDHTMGLRLVERWVGRWAFAFGLSLWLTLPMGFVWGVWAGAWPGWWWILGGALTAAVATAASLAAAGR
ncbi:hypothetical protein BH23GEM3_BH23GEM3_05960 [soil metagenome]